MHPAFAKYMPTFIGTLTAAPEGVAAGLASASAQSTNSASQNAHPNKASNKTADSSTDSPVAAELDETGQIALPKSIPPQDEAWVPSGGRKLETGISIVLENVASGFTRPNVIDIKLGARLWGDDSVPDKRAKLDKVSRETTSSSLGFRIAGMKVWGGEAEAKKQAEQAIRENETATPTDADKNGSEPSKVKVVEVDGYRRYDRWFGRSFNEHNIKEGFETFLEGAKIGKKDNSRQIAARMATELRSIQSMLEAEESRMYSSSILYIYEGDPEAFEEALAEEAKEKEKVKEESESGSESGDAIQVSVLGEGELSLEKGEELRVGADATTFEEEEDEAEEPPKVDDIRLIDFAHASWTPGRGPDENALHGIRNLAQIMEEIARTDPPKPSG